MQPDAPRYFIDKAIGTIKARFATVALSPAEAAGLSSYVEQLVLWALDESRPQAQGGALVLSAKHLDEKLRWAAIDVMKLLGLWRIKLVLPVLLESPAFRESQHDIWMALYHLHSEYNADYLPWLVPVERPLASAEPDRGRAQPRPASDLGTRPLRVGVWSNKVGNYSSSMTYVHPWLLHLPDPSIEVFVISDRKGVAKDPLLPKYRQVFGSRLIETHGLSDEEFSQRVLDLDLDVFIPLSNGIRPGIIGRRLSRCHVDYLADLYIHGVADVTLIGRGMADPALVHSTARRFIVIPDPLFVSSPRPAVSFRERNPSAPFCFAAFSREQKLNALTFDLWAHVMRECPGARFHWTSFGARASTTVLVQAEFAKRGVDPARIGARFGDLPTSAHLDTYSDVDLVLDSYPLGSSVTAVDAFWMGVPLLFRGGDKRTSPMVTTTYLSQVGPEGGCCARTHDAFVAYAKARYAEGPRPVARRASLRARAVQAALFDGSRYTALMKQVVRIAATLPAEKLTYVG